MQKETQFLDDPFSDSDNISLTPWGRGFFQEDQEDGLTDADKIDEITSARKAFWNACGYTSQRSSDIRPHFLCKANFIFKNRQCTMSKDVICHLLSDSKTLFSRSYQVYTSSHPYYRSFRNDTGKTPQEQHESCVTYAMTQCPQQNDIYSSLLNRLFTYASNCKCHVFTLQDKLLTHFLPDDTDGFFNKVIAPGLQELSDETSDILCKHMILSYLDAASSCPETKRATCLKYLSFFALGGETILHQLKEWIPDTSLSCEDASTFICNCLRHYCEQEYSIISAQKISGHFKDKYRIADYSVYQDYQENLNRLSGYLSSLESTSTNLAANLSDLYIFSQEPSQATHTILSQIDINALSVGFQKYLRTIGVTANNLFVEGAANQILLHCHRHNIADCFPFYCMLLFIIGKSILFSERSNRCLTFNNSEEICKCLRRIQTQSSSSQKHRCAQIKFLYDICCSCQNLKISREECWNLFFKFCGFKPLSNAEKNLYIKISAESDIPIIKLQLEVDKRLHLCLPICEETQYCYIPGSLLHLGKYAVFLKKHPDALNICINKIYRHKKTWEKHIKSYFKEWSSATFSIHSVNLICEEIAAHQKWKNVPGFSTSELESLFGIKPSHSDFNLLVKELKRLLVESAIRRILNDNARDILTNLVYKSLFQG